MRRLCLALFLGAAACAHETQRLRAVAGDVEGPAAPPSSSAAQYLIADPLPARGGAVVVPLGAGGVRGIVVEKRRIIIGRGEPRVAADEAPAPILGTERVPARLGGGFLFWTASSIYHADTFDGPLLPVASTPEPIDSISFAPKAVLVRTRNGERWGIGLPKGDRAPLGPTGFADIQALDDGRAATFDDQGAAFTSTDNGEHWTNVTTQMRTAPSGLSTIEGELWLHEKNGGGWRLEPDGHLAWFDKEPDEAAALQVRPKDPRWRASDPPLRTVFRGGAVVDDNTAVVIESGDLIRIDVHTGEIKSIAPAHLPPDSRCQALAVPGDVLFACVSRGPSGGGGFVVSRALSGDVPLMEQTFADGQFFASDDGGLAHTGSCQGIATTTPDNIVCVRTPGGRWEERDLSGFAPDGGTSPDLAVSRWVPRADGRVVALISEPLIALYDPQTMTTTPLPNDLRNAFVYGSRRVTALHVGIARLARGGSTADIIDDSWSFTSNGHLRGWERHESFDIAEDGHLAKSPYAFEVISAGAYGLGRGEDGRLYQSEDHGATWTEVAGPPGGVEALELVGCSPAGCDLGAFYRVGWQQKPPQIEPARAKAPPAPEVRRTPGLTLTCRPNGAVATRMLPHGADSPDDLGLGAVRLPAPHENSETSYVRNPIGRAIVGPIHEHDGDDGDSSPSLRAMTSGYATSRDADVITVRGPNKNVLALRRGFAFVAPFDPQGRIVRASIAISEVLAAGRRIGLQTDEILGDDPTESGNVVPLLSLDANGPSDVLLHNAEHGLLSIARGERVRVAMRGTQTNANIVSGVLLPNDEQAFLEVEASGAGHVYKVGASGPVDLFDIGLPEDDLYYPANLDALAVGPKNELVILRTPSGSDPASAIDPAFVIAPSASPIPLAPWSEAKLADDPICKSDPGGYRAVVQTIGPWIKVMAPELRVDDAPMLLRVRWTQKHACIEGFEVRLPTVTLRPTGSSGGDPTTFATMLVARNSAFARITVGEGLEWRQPLECAVVN